MVESTGYWYCYSPLSRRIKMPDGFAHELPKINHAQGENSKTLCGILYGLEWRMDWSADTSVITCKRCLKKL